MTTLTTATTVFGIDPSQVSATAQALDAEASEVVAAAGRLAAGVPSAASLPGGRTVAALTEGAGRVAEAVGGEARVVETASLDLRTVVDAVDRAEQDAVESFSTTPPATRPGTPDGDR
jgi:hypothetical protein